MGEHRAGQPGPNETTDRPRDAANQTADERRKEHAHADGEEEVEFMLEAKDWVLLKVLDLIKVVNALATFVDHHPEDVAPPEPA